MPLSENAHFRYLHDQVCQDLDVSYWMERTQESDDGTMEFESRNSGGFNVGSATDFGYPTSTTTEKNPKRMEDRVLIDIEHGLFGVFDGVGGLEYGEVAATIAAQTLHELYQGTPKERRLDPHLMRSFFTLVDMRLRVFAEKKGLPNGIDTCGTVVVLSDDVEHEYRQGLIGHIGDTRGYLFRGDRSLFPLTVDDSVSRLRRADDIARRRDHEAHKIENSMGYVLPWTVAHIRKFDLLHGDEALLLSTDGVHDVLSAHATERDSPMKGMELTYEKIRTLFREYGEKYTPEQILEGLLGTSPFRQAAEIDLQLQMAIRRGLFANEKIMRPNIADIITDSIARMKGIDPQDIAMSLIQAVKEIPGAKRDNRAALVIC